MNSILYYPKINITDGAWLRNALLYWDEVCSIVPEGLEDSYLTEELKWLQRDGVYRPIIVNRDNEIFKQDAFKEELKSGLKQLYDNNNQLRESRREDSFAYLHYQKVPEYIIEYISEYELMLDNNIITNNLREWKQVPQEVSNYYMSMLSKYIACSDEANMVIGTDQNDFLSLPFGNHERTADNMCVDLIFQEAFPMPSMEASFDDILKFKSDHQRELHKFRSTLKELRKKLESCSEYDEIKEELFDYRTQWMDSIGELEDSLKSSKLRFYFGTLVNTLAIDFPQFLSLISSNSNCLLGVSLAAKGVIGIGKRYLDNKEKNKKLIRENEFTYLFKGMNEDMILKSEFNPNI